jgi:hypothetical protein
MKAAADATVTSSSIAAFPVSGAHVLLGSTGGFSGAVDFPAPTVGAGSHMNVSVQTTLPASMPAIVSAQRRPASSAGSRNAGLLYILFVPLSEIDFPSSPSFTINLPQPAARGVSYYLATFDPNDETGWVLGTVGPAVVAGSTLTFSGAATPLW